jgi:acyl-CoA hydrolase
MEIGARVETEDLMTGSRTHLASAYLTFVALDENKKPVHVPPITPATKDDIRRQKEAIARKKLRLSEKRKEKECRKNTC